RDVRPHRRRRRVGNVTGSNAVNVFLGLGLPWMIGALYWSRKGGGFVVPAGDLGYSVTVFCVCAVLCLGMLTLRRSVLGGELGGPSWAAARDRSQGAGVAQALLQKRVVAVSSSSFCG
uniref:Sodium/calcium exchanger membrane region domain-containing protein n=2 Tax=Emiliania huxleyi TaxID=2903 RepID=A0A0D3J593_EMIH1